MKKNNTMRVAAGLAVAALLSTCLVSGTYAKYVTSAGASDGARVAKFGVEITPDAYADIFSDEYSTTVKSATKGDDVVAPGTSGQAQAVEVTGTPEVSVKVTNSANVTLSGWEAEGAYYCPVTVKVGNKALNGNDYASMAEFKAAIEKAVSDTTATYNPGETIDTTGCPAVSWEWAFEGAQGAKQTDAKDTALGQAQTAAKIDITVTTTVTQID